MVLRVLGLAAQLKFSLVQFSGRLYAEGPGFGMRDGVMTGYLSKEDGVGLVQGILDDCMREDAPDLCGSVLNLLGVPESEEELLEVVESFIGGFDAHLGPTGPMACAPETEAPCDALSVCLVLDLEGVQLEGVAP